MDARVQSFMKVVESNPGLWQSIDMRVLGVRIRDQWHNLMTTCHLDPRRPDELARLEHLPMTQYAACWQHVTPIDALPDLLANLNAGWVAIGKVTVYFRQNLEDEKAADTSYRSWSYHFADISERHSASSSPWSSHRLVAWGESIHNLLG
jgi:hypothetical protein